MNNSVAVFLRATLIVLVCWGLMWLGWVWAMPQLFPTGPRSLTHPNFWVFTIATFLVRGLITPIPHGKSKL